MVLDYELWRNEGLDGSEYTIVSGYDYLINGFTYTVVVDDEVMVPGRFY